MVPLTTNTAVGQQPDLTPEELREAIEASLRDFKDGDLVSGKIVKIDRDEVLLDIGYKTEGVIPSRELSIKHDVDPSQVVSVGDRVEALVLQKEDKEGRLILSKKRAQYERAWGDIETIKAADGVVEGYFLGTYSGRKLGMPSTGNAGGSHNIVVRSGSLDFAGLLRQMGRGLVVTELLGQGVNTVTGDYSRGAAGFWIENGEKTYAVSEITIAGHLLDIFKSLMPGNDLEFRYGTNAPTIRVEGLTIAGV